MRLLALESGGPELGAAAFEDGRLRLSRAEAAPQRHAERLALQVQGLLQAMGWDPGSLDAVAVAVGPGSFTGLRSGLAFAQGMALGRPCRLFAVPTLHAWAQAAAIAGEERAEVWMDARRGLVFRARLRLKEGAWEDLEAQAMLPLPEAARGLSQTGLLVSDLGAAAGAALPKGLRVAPRPGGEAVAVAAAALAWARWQRGDAGLLPQDLDALYLRRSEAEVLWDSLHPAPG